MKNYVQESKPHLKFPPPLSGKAPPLIQKFFRLPPPFLKFWLESQIPLEKGAGCPLCVCCYHVTYAFQSESTLYSCMNLKEFLARNRLEIRSLSDCNWTRTHNHLVHKRTLNHLAKLAS